MKWTLLVVLLALGCAKTERVIERETKPLVAQPLTIDSEFFFVACTIVHNPITQAWEILSDGAHSPLNCTSVTTTGDTAGDYVVVSYGRTASDVVTMSTDADDTYATNGYFMGASVGLSAVYIQFAQLIDGEIVGQSPQDVYAGSGEGVWILGMMRQ
jgi:hypothetical protein